MKFLKNNMASMSIDFLTAISIMLFTLMFGVVAIGQMITPYDSIDNRQHLDNTLSVLISHPSTDASIGLSEIGLGGIVGTELDKHFIKHQGRLNWYELSDMSTLRDMGFSKYLYYIQVLPVDGSKFDRGYTEQKAINKVNGGVVDSVVRHKMLTYTETGVFYGEDLFGKYDPTKVIIIFDGNDTVNFENDITLSFSEFIPDGTNNTQIKSFKIGDYFDNTSESVKPNIGICPDVYVNGIQADASNKIDINTTDTVDIILNQTCLNVNLGDWRKNGFAFEFDFAGISIKDGTTDYNTSVRMISEPYKIVAWSWFNE